MPVLESLAELTAKIAKTRLAIANAEMENSKRVVSNKLVSLQNEKILLLEAYVSSLGGDSDYPLPGSWVINITHVGGSRSATAHAREVISAETAQNLEGDLFWAVVEMEVERIIRSIDRLEGAEARPRRPRSGDTSSLMQDDMAELLRALGLGDHARSISPHEVMQLEILPVVRLMMRRIT